MRYLSVYSGIGLHDRGFEAAGFTCAGQIELDPFCTAVLEKHWPNLPRWADVRQVTVDAVRAACGFIDCITGGFMCTDISVAGKGAGIGKTTRSGLTWRNLFRLIRGLRPLFLIIENVPALRTRGADRVLAALERIGYACLALVVGAEHVGAPHRRHRVWIVGRYLGPVQLDDATSGGRKSTERAQKENRSADARRDAGKLSNGLGGSGQSDLANTNGSGLGESGRAIAVPSQQPAIERAGTHSERRLANTDSERIADANESRRIGRPDRTGAIDAGGSSSAFEWPARPGQQQHDWEAPRLTQFPVGASVDGRAVKLERFANRNSLKAVGNANPSQVAEVIGRAILAAAAAAASPPRAASRTEGR